MACLVLGTTSLLKTSELRITGIAKRLEKVLKGLKDFAVSDLTGAYEVSCGLQIDLGEGTFLSYDNLSFQQEQFMITFKCLLFLSDG